MHPKTLDSAFGLMTQFLAWVDRQPRNYAETMDAWRTSCPRISVWEDALIDGLIDVRDGDDQTQGAVRIVLTEAGMRRLQG